MSTATDPRVHDNDINEITVTLDGKEIRGWSYENEAERRMKMLAAREFCEGWFQAIEHQRNEADNAAEAAYLDHQQSLMETGGPDDGGYRRDMINAGRGHLIGGSNA